MIIMAIIATCACGKSLRAKDHHAGRNDRCPKCGQAVLLDGPPVETVQPAVAAPVPPAPARVVVPSPNPADSLTARRRVAAAIPTWLVLIQSAPFSRKTQALIAQHKETRMFHGLIHATKESPFGYEMELLHLVGPEVQGSGVVFDGDARAIPRLDMRKPPK
jgi:hypothetical protein